MGRILSIDLGERRVGLAISDETQTIAQGLDTINFKNEQDLIERVKLIIKERMVSEIVIGHPLSLSSQETQRSAWVKDFIKELEKKISIPINLFDERLTSQMAMRFLEEAKSVKRGVSNRPFVGANRPRFSGKTRLGGLPKNAKTNRAKSAIDKIAAIIILEDYLASKKRNCKL
jgi:putative Holliday junction resolvase